MVKKPLSTRDGHHARVCPAAEQGPLLGTGDWRGTAQAVAVSSCPASAPVTYSVGHAFLVSLVTQE